MYEWHAENMKWGFDYDRLGRYFHELFVPLLLEDIISIVAGIL